MLLSNQFDLSIIPGSLPPVLHLSQYDSGRQFVANLKDEDGSAYDPPGTPTATIEGTNLAGVAWQIDCTIIEGAITFTLSGAATDQPGITAATITLHGTNEQISPLHIILDIQKAGATNEAIAAGSEFMDRIERAVQDYIDEHGIIPSGALLASDQAAKTSGMTQAVGVDDNGKLWTTPGGGGGGSDLPELHIGDLGKALMAVDSGEDDPEWGVAFDTPVYVTITRDGSSYTVPVGTYTTLSTAISNNRVVEAYTPEGLAHFAGVEGTALKFQTEQDIGDNMSVVRYKINSDNSVTRTVWVVDNEAVTPAGIGAAPAVTVNTITESTTTITPGANNQYVCTTPIIAMEVSSSFAATGDWSIEFDAPTNVAPAVSLPSALKLPDTVTFAANKHYEINCHNGYAIVAEW